MLQLVDSRNLGTDAEIHALQAERDLLTAQLAAGRPPIVMPLRPPRISTSCSTCLRLWDQLEREVAAARKAQRKRAAMHGRFRNMLRKQDEYRREIGSLIRQLATARARMAKAGVPANGPVTRRVTNKRRKSHELPRDPGE